MEQAEERSSTAVLKQRRLPPKIGKTATQIEGWHNHASKGKRRLWGTGSGHGHQKPCRGTDPSGTDS